MSGEWSHIHDQVTYVYTFLVKELDEALVMSICELMYTCRATLLELPMVHSTLTAGIDIIRTVRIISMLTVCVQGA